MDELSNSALEAELDRLEKELSVEAACFRGCRHDDDVCREEEVETYHAIFNRMFELGWRERLLDEDTLPWNLMPEAYRIMYPDPERAQLYTEDDYHVPRKVEYKPIKIGDFSLLQKMQFWFKSMFFPFRIT